jgi:hypothetical protein
MVEIAVSPIVALRCNPDEDDPVAIAPIMWRSSRRFWADNSTALSNKTNTRPDRILNQPKILKDIRQKNPVEYRIKVNVFMSVISTGFIV